MNPRLIKVELTSRCNAQCIFCDHPSSGEDMDWDMFIQILDEFPGETVQLQFFGEPLLYPRIVEAVEEVHARGKRAQMYTNGSLLSGELAERMAQAAPELIVFSIDSHIPEVYESLRPPLKFDEVLDNVTRFQALKRPETRTVVSSLSTAETQPEIRKTAEFWSRFVDDVRVQQEQPRTRQATPRKCRTCDYPWTEMVVKADGRFVACCVDWHGTRVVGHISDGLMNVWRDGYKLARREPYALCRTCVVSHPSS